VSDMLKNAMEDNYGKYFGIKKDTTTPLSSSSSASASSSSASNPNANSLPPTEFLTRLADNITLMCQERNTYCEAVMKVIQQVYNETSEYVNKLAKRYSAYIESYYYSRQSSKAEFSKRVKHGDRQRGLYFSSGGTKDKPASHIRTSDDSSRLRYWGSEAYQKKREETAQLRHLINSLMDKEETIFYFGASPVQRGLNLEFGQHFVHTRFTTRILEELAPGFGLFESHGESSMDVEDLAVMDELKKAGLSHYYSYAHHVDLCIPNPQEDHLDELLYYNVFCISGIPEAILYDELTLLKWITLVSRSKTDPMSKAFNNTKNKDLPSLYELISSAWTAKMGVMLGEYDEVSTRYENTFITNTFLHNLASSSSL